MKDPPPTKTEQVRRVRTKYLPRDMVCPNCCICKRSSKQWPCTRDRSQIRQPILCRSCDALRDLWVEGAPELLDVVLREGGTYVIDGPKLVQHREHVLKISCADLAHHCCLYPSHLYKIEKKVSRVNQSTGDAIILGVLRIGQIKDRRKKLSKYGQS